MRILEQLAEPDSAAGVARRLKLPRQQISYHLRELEHAGLVELVEERRKGNCLERVVRAIRDLAVLCGRAEKAGKRLSTMALEVEVRFASAEARNGFAEELAATV